MYKINSMVVVTDPAKVITDNTHESFALLEPINVKGSAAGEVAMVVGKTMTSTDGLCYLLATPDNQNMVVKAEGLAMGPVATDQEIKDWFFDTFCNQAGDWTRQFTMSTKKNVPETPAVPQPKA